MKNGAHDSANQGQSWRAKLLFPLATAALFLLGVESGGFQSVLTDIAQTYGLSHAMMGGMATAQYIALVAMPLIFGHISDKVGKKRILAIFIIALIMGCVLSIFATSSWMLRIGVFFVGSGYGICECLFTAAISDSDPQRAERKITLMQAFFSIGAVASPVAAGFLMNNGLGWHIVFILVGAGFAAIFPVLLFTHFRMQSAVITSEKPPESPLKLLTSKLFMLMLVSIMMYSGLEVGVSYFADSFLSFELAAPELGSTAISIFWLLTAVSRLVFSRVNVNAMRSIYILYGLLFVALAVLAISADAYFALSLYAVIGFLIAPIWGMILATATKRFAKQSGFAASILMAGCGIGASLFPIALGAVADVFGFRGSIGLLAMIALLICMIGIWNMRRKTFE